MNVLAMLPNDGSDVLHDSEPAKTHHESGGFLLIVKRQSVLLVSGTDTRRKPGLLNI